MLSKNRTDMSSVANQRTSFVIFILKLDRNTVRDFYVLITKMQLDYSRFYFVNDYILYKWSCVTIIRFISFLAASSSITRLSKIQNEPLLSDIKCSQYLKCTTSQSRYVTAWIIKRLSLYYPW